LSLGTLDRVIDGCGETVASGGVAYSKRAETIFVVCRANDWHLKGGAAMRDMVANPRGAQVAVVFAFVVVGATLGCCNGQLGADAGALRHVLTHDVGAWFARSVAKPRRVGGAAVKAGQANTARARVGITLADDARILVEWADAYLVDADKVATDE